MKILNEFIIVIITLYKLNSYLISQEDEDNGIFLLNEDNYDSFIKKNELILLFLYDNPCKLCNQIIPELKKTSELLNILDPPVKIASINCSENPQIKRRLNVNHGNIYFSFSLRFILNEKPMNYTGGRSSEEIVSWVKALIKPTIEEIKSINQLEDLRQYLETLVVFFGYEEFLFNYFVNVAKLHPNMVFVHCTVIECLDYFQVNNGNIILFTNLGEIIQQNFSLIKDYSNEEDIIEFINKNSQPTIMKFNFKTANLIFEKKTPGLFLYISADKIKTYDSILNNVAIHIKDKLQIVITGIVGIAEGKLADMIGVKSNDLPKLMIHDTREKLKSYALENTITEDNILKFVENWENNKLSRYVKSEKLAKLHDSGLIYTLVGSNIEESVLDTSKDVLVVFYAPWCKYSKEIIKLIERCAARIKSDNLIIAKLDAYHNDALVIDLSYYPTLALWKANDKMKHIEFKLERTEENILKFLQFHSFYPITYN